MRPPQDLLHPINGDLKTEVDRKKGMHHWLVGWWARGPCTNGLLDACLPA